jgi:hypothetical protein
MIGCRQQRRVHLLSRQARGGQSSRQGSTCTALDTANHKALYPNTAASRREQKPLYRSRALSRRRLPVVYAINACGLWASIAKPDRDQRSGAPTVGTRGDAERYVRAPLRPRDASSGSSRSFADVTGGSLCFTRLSASVYARQRDLRCGREDALSAAALSSSAVRYQSCHSRQANPLPHRPPRWSGTSSS